MSVDAAHRMLDRSSIWKAEINERVAREGLTQAEKMLADTVETKKATDQKATSLFTAYVTLTLALFGVGGITLRDRGASAALPFMLAGVVLGLGAIAFLMALRPAEYGNPGDSPKTWLASGVIDSPADKLARMLALTLHTYDEKLTASERANDTKAAWLRRGLYAGPLAAAVFATAFLLSAAGA